MSLRVDLILEPGLATVVPDRRAPHRGGRAAERFRGGDRTDLVAAAVRGARCLRTLRRVDLRVVLETPEVLLRTRSGPTVRTGGPTAHGPVVVPTLTVVPTSAGPGGDALDVGLPSELVAEVADGLRQRRCWGPARMELGVLVRAATVLRAAGPALRGRSGVIVDVTRAAVTVLELDGADVVGARAVPAADVRAALDAALPAVRGRLAGCGDGSVPSRPWLHLAVPSALEAGVRAACAAALPAGGAVDLLRVARGPR